MFQTDSHLQQTTNRPAPPPPPQGESAHPRPSNTTAPRGRHQGAQEEQASVWNSPRHSSPHADSCVHMVHRVSNPKPSVCAGITNPRWGPLPPPPHRVIGAWPLQMQELPRNGTTPFDKVLFPPPPHPAHMSGQGVRDGTRALHDPLPTVMSSSTTPPPLPKACVHYPFRPSDPTSSLLRSV